MSSDTSTDADTADGGGEVEDHFAVPDLLDTDDVLRLLKNERRRMVIELMADRESVRISELAEAIAARQNDTDVAELTSQQRKRVYVALYQTHLPKLRKAGVVENGRETYTPGPHYDRVLKAMDGVMKAADPDYTPRHSLGARLRKRVLSLFGWDSRSRGSEDLGAVDGTPDHEQ